MEQNSGGKTGLYVFGAVLLFLILAAVLGIMTGIIPARSGGNKDQAETTPNATTVIDQRPATEPTPMPTETPDEEGDPADVPEMTLPEEEQVYTISVSCGKGGDVSPGGTSTVVRGGSMSVTVLPDSGYVIESVMVDGNSVGTSSTVTLADVQSNHTIYVAFTPSAGTGSTDTQEPEIPGQTPDSDEPDTTAARYTYPADFPHLVNE